MILLYYYVLKSITHTITHTTSITLCKIVWDISHPKTVKEIVKQWD